MKFLVLDDSQERLTAFVDNNPTDDVTCVETVEKAIEKLLSEKWDCVCLDHDLGGKAYCPSDENSGFWVAKFLRDNPQHKPHIVILHSLNYNGRQNMLGVLPDAVDLPWCWEKRLFS